METIKQKLSTKTIKQQLSPPEFYQTEIGLNAHRDHGWIDGGLCPFHEDSRAGNFRVNLDFGGYCCFACGSKGSDVIAFIQERDGLSFPETLCYLNETYGVS